MKGLQLKAIPVTLFGLTLAITVAAVALSLGLEPLYDTLLYALLGLTLGAAGAVVASQHPRNRIGWMFLGLAILNVLADLAQGWGLRAAEQGWPGGAAGDWIQTWSWMPTGLGWVLIFLLFPDGRLISRRWRFVPWCAALALVLGVPGRSLSPDRDPEFASGSNPLAVEALPTDALMAVGMTLHLVAALGAVVALVVRLRRSHGVERQQLKWFALAATIAVVVLSLSFALWDHSALIRVLAALSLTSLPIAACVAILRYRLYDIDVVISRTLVYGALTVALAAAFGATTLVLGAALGSGSAWTTAAATLVVATAFRPLRARLQDAVDRRFNRARHAALERIAGFLEDLRAGRAAPERIEELLRDILADPRLELRFFLPESEVYVDANGRAATDPPGDGRERTAIGRAGAPLAMVIHGPAGEGGPEGLPQVVEAAGLAIEIARLRVDLRRHLDEVKASRARLVAAGDEERRRIERDLHDGAQQRLVSIGLALRHAQHELNGASPSAGHALEGAVAEIAVAIEELRELARGVRPAQLDAGLAPALRELAGRAPLRVEVAATAERFPHGVEAAAYFVASEGLTNAIKHARASRVVLRAAPGDGRLVVSVADDGVGGARASDGSGLAGLSDRVIAQGGALSIESDPGTGTRLTAELPCGW